MAFLIDYSNQFLVALAYWNFVLTDKLKRPKNYNKTDYYNKKLAVAAN